MFAVTVTFRVEADQMERFLPLVIDNAQASLAHEPGCRQFDVCTGPDQPDVVFLYEIYDSADAFAAHLETDHFQAFDLATAGMFASKTVGTFAEVRQ